MVLVGDNIIMHRALKEAQKAVSSQEWEMCFSQEKRMTGSAFTGDEEFDRLGYKVIRNVCDPKLLITPVPPIKTGQLRYTDTGEEYLANPLEKQVKGSVARYTYPPYKEPYNIVQKNIEKSIGQPLYKTYYYDRFYFPGQDLKLHSDRPPCEISITVHVSTNLKDEFPVYIKTVDGDVSAVNLQSGDGMVYKGCERPHWRLKMPGVKRNKVRKLLGKDELYYHQAFFHYVLANGHRSHHAGDEIHDWL